MPLCFLAREAQQVLRASDDPGEKKRLGQGAMAQGSAPGTASCSHLQQDISLRGGILARNWGVPLLKQTVAAGSTAAFGTVTMDQVLHRHKTHTSSSRCLAPSGSTPQPCPRGSRVSVPAAPSRKWGNSRTVTIIIHSKKKICKRPSTLSCSARTPKRTRSVTV